MKIWFDTVQLADDGAEGVSGFRINGLNPEVTQTPILGDTEPKIRDGLNERNTISFSIARTHASPADAEVYLLTHKTEIPHLGILKIVASKGDGQEVTRWLGTPDNKAGLTSFDGSYSGSTTYHTYNFIGGVIRLEDPTKGAA